MSQTAAPTPAGDRVVRVWDLPTRLFHWALVVALIAQGYRAMAVVFLLVFVLPLLTLGAARLWRERTIDLSPEEAAHV